jgi:hypothetical protein
LRETKKIHVASKQPSFSLEPSMVALGGSILGLNLVNHGEAASNLQLTYMWGEKLEDLGGSAKSYFVLSLAKGGRTPLSEVPIGDIITKGWVLKINIKYRNSIGLDNESIIRIDFASIKGTSTSIGFQYDNDKAVQSDLDNITRALGKIESSIDKLGSRR